MLEKLLAKRHIQNLNLTSVRMKLIETLGWTSDQARRVEGDYKRFLYALAHKRPDDILSPPTQEVDEFWHQHILDTRKYREDCDTIFGHYVDHTPGLDPEKQRRADQRRREIYREYDVDSISFETYPYPSSRRDGGSYGESGGGDSFEDGHSAHGHHDASSSHHGTDSSAHGCDSSGHGGDAGSCDSGGSDGGSGDGGGCGGGGCGGGGCGGG